MISDAMSRKPNPGSWEALAQGCICPVVDNAFGKIPPYPPYGWWVVIGCQVHAPMAPRVRRLLPEDCRETAGQAGGAP